LGRLTCTMAMAAYPATVTQYLLDVQPGLAVVLSETTGSTTTRYVHTPMGIHMVNEGRFILQDGLGSVRSVVNKAITVQEIRQYDPYGTPFGPTGTSQTDYGFTGEPTNDIGLVYLRVRTYRPDLGIFTSLDPFEGTPDRPMSLNGYSYVEGNPANLVDPSGMIGEKPEQYASCTGYESQSECAGRTENECENCCWEKWRGELPDNAEAGLSKCIRSCIQSIPAIDVSSQRCTDLRNYAQLLVGSARYNGRERPTKVIRFAQTAYNYSDARQLADDISCALTGARGPTTILQGRYDVPKADELGRYGWHSSYDDETTNQAFHFWAYVNTAAQGGILGGIGDYFHECWDIFDPTGRSWADTRLAIAGIILGDNIKHGLPSCQVDDWVEYWLTRPFDDLLQSQGLGYEILINISLTIRICPLIDIRAEETN
jgi:RHS repeat-associated protein